MTSRKRVWYFGDDDAPQGGWQQIPFAEDPTFDSVVDEPDDPPLDLWRGLSKLTESQRFVIHLRYGLGGCQAIPLEDIAVLMKISNQAVSRIEKRALAALRRGLEEFPKDDGIQQQRGSEEDQEAHR